MIDNANYEVSNSSKFLNPELFPNSKFEMFFSVPCFQQSLTLSLLLRGGDPASKHPYKTPSRIRVLYILIDRFLDSRRENK
jgi:hypothetical protein